MELCKIINYLKENHPPKALEINECLGLLVYTLDSTLTSIQDSSNSAFSQRDFNKIKVLADMANEISQVQDEIKKYMDSLEPEEISEISNEEDDDEKVRTLPNYGDYIVDSNIPHTLYEDFTHKRPAAFEMESTKIEAKTWQEVLLLTSEILIKKDITKFESFASDTAMNGKKVNYFSSTAEGMRSPEIISTVNMYVETNMSSNSIRNLIVKMLRKYDIKINDYLVYYRADYTTLHQ